MDFLDKLGEIAKDTINKTSDSLEINRINNDITLELNNIAIYERQLGQHFWRKFIEGEAMSEEPLHICNKIVASQDKIRVLEGEIAKIKRDREAQKAERAERKRREAEQSDLEEESSDTSDEEEQTEPVKDHICDFCGAVLTEEQNFCGNCGKPTTKKDLDD